MCSPGPDQCAWSRGRLQGRSAPPSPVESSAPTDPPPPPCPAPRPRPHPPPPPPVCRLCAAGGAAGGGGPALPLPLGAQQAQRGGGRHRARHGRLRLWLRHAGAFTFTPCPALPCPALKKSPALLRAVAFLPLSFRRSAHSSQLPAAGAHSLAWRVQVFGGSPGFGLPA